MAHFAKLGVGNIVEQVIVISDDVSNTEQQGIDFINKLYNTRDVWKQTSYNTFGGIHKKNGTPFRKNYAGIGYTYDQNRDAFIAPKPFSSWILDEESCRWIAPKPIPNAPLDENEFLFWNEETLSWEKRVRPQF
jgi:hypothetical protein